VKKFVAIIGLGLLAFPLLRHLTFKRRLDSSDSSAEVVSALLSVSSGFMMGFVGLMILGFLVDGGSGYRKPALLILMAVFGGLWIAFYPSGWLLGAPLIVYPLLRRFGFGARTIRKEDQ
jgi:hypothetical protein